ncbi:MAG TPA: hypothetical protein VHI71_01320 [Actinomycetota bacterium]|nr:hypothetical protein [Actinomycetota bacterium]
MTRRDERALAALLQEVARSEAWPPTPPLAEQVRARIERGPLPVAQVRLPRTRPSLLRPLAATFVVVGVALGITLSLSGAARRAVADLLGVVGIDITFDGDPAVTPRPQRAIPLGPPVSRAAASESAGFDVKVPAAVAGRPAFHYDPSIGATGMVSVVYPRSAARMSEVDLLVTQFVAAVDESYVKKLVAAGAKVAHVDVRSSQGYWIGGGPHLFFYRDGDGVQDETVRLAGRVLLWEEDGITYRVEGAGSLAEATRIAESLR